MAEDQKWNFIQGLDTELLKGSVILSEWSTLLIKEADLAFVHGAHLACLITAMAAVESHLKYEFAGKGRKRFVDLIDSSSVETDLIAELHLLRRYRNRWVHVQTPQDDHELLEDQQMHGVELEAVARRAIRALRRVLYSWQWI